MSVAFISSDDKDDCGKDFVQLLGKDTTYSPVVVYQRPDRLEKPGWEICLLGFSKSIFLEQKLQLNFKPEKIDCNLESLELVKSEVSGYRHVPLQ